MNLDRSFYRVVTIHAFDGRTDGQTDGRTEFSSLDRVCIPCSAVKTFEMLDPIVTNSKLSMGYHAQLTVQHIRKMIYKPSKPVVSPEFSTAVASPGFVERKGKAVSHGAL